MLAYQSMCDCALNRCLESYTFREGSQEFFKDLSDANVPVLVFSAGCGDVVLAILQQSGVYSPNMKVSGFVCFGHL